jgi:hypothetical protein
LIRTLRFTTFNFWNYTTTTAFQPRPWRCADCIYASWSLSPDRRMNGLSRSFISSEYVFVNFYFYVFF